MDEPGRRVALKNLLARFPAMFAARLLESPGAFELLTGDYIPANGNPAHVLLLSPHFRGDDAEAMRVDDLLEAEAKGSADFSYRFGLLLESLFLQEGYDSVIQHAEILIRHDAPGIRRSSFEWLKLRAGFGLRDYPWEAPIPDDVRKGRPDGLIRGRERARLREVEERVATVREWLLER